jgi:signal transduction histidine kinase
MEERKKQQKELRVVTHNVTNGGRRFAARVSSESYIVSISAVTSPSTRGWIFQEAHTRLERRAEQLIAELVHANLRLKEETAQRKQAEAAGQAYAEEIRKLNRDLERRARRLSALHNASQAIATSFDKEEILRFVTACIRESLDVEEVSVYLRDSLIGDLVIAATIPSDPGWTGVRIPEIAGIIGWSVHEKQAALVNDIRNDPSFCAQIEVQDGMLPRSFLAVPMITGDDVIGVISAINKRDGQFTRDDLEIAEMMASCAAIAIQNSRLCEAEQEQSQSLKALQAQLIEVEKMADLGRIAVTLAHEINNPLQAMQSHLELAMDFPLPLEERRQCLCVTRQEIGRLSEITQRVLNFARPTIAQPHPVSIAELVRQTLALTSKQLQRSNIQVTTDIPELLQVLAVPDQLVQVFLNLVINAIEAIHDHGHIQIHAHAEGSRGVVSFANDGPIIPPEDLSRIFERYFTSKPDGTGLGLPVSQHLVQQHGGTLTAMNQANGKGALFTIELPLMCAAIPTAG